MEAAVLEPTAGLSACRRAFIAILFHVLPGIRYPVNLIPMITFAGHSAMMMVMEMPSPGHFVMPRVSRGLMETGRLN